jgi:hypothetical protein
MGCGAHRRGLLTLDGLAALGRDVVLGVLDHLGQGKGERGDGGGR